MVQSELLSDNALGDSARRPLLVYRPPGLGQQADEAVPSVYVIQGYSGQVDMWLARSAFEPTFIERLDAMFEARECAPGPANASSWSAVMVTTHSFSAPACARKR